MAHDNCFYCTDEYKDYMKEVAKLSHSRVYLNNEQYEETIARIRAHL